MFYSFHEQLNEFIGKTVRIYMEGGVGFVGCVLSVERDYIEVISVSNLKNSRHKPNTFTVVPVHKISAIAAYSKGNNSLALNDINGTNESLSFPTILTIIAILLLMNIKN